MIRPKPINFGCLKVVPHSQLLSVVLLLSMTTLHGGEEFMKAIGIGDEGLQNVELLIIIGGSLQKLAMHGGLLHNHKIWKKQICFGLEGVARDELVFGMLKHGHVFESKDAAYDDVMKDFPFELSDIFNSILTAWWLVDHSIMKLRCGRQGMMHSNCQSQLYLINLNITDLEE
ncbi:hypothetical protein JHK84_055082 [Glycine max]|nr:hypothetical protein JHK84_055082 [Glycine max]